MGVRMPLAAATSLVAALVLAAPSVAASGYRAGAGMAITTPPLAGTPEAAAADARFAQEIAQRCPAAAFPDRGTFGLQEPFDDLNHNGRWDSGEDGKSPPEPFCDANGNGHWDGIYTSGQTAMPADGVHDQIDARAFAVARGHQTPLVYVSVVEQGLFENVTDAIRERLRSVYHVKADVVVSADHNESSPDTVGIYGAYDLPGVDVSARSGIDEFYLRFLEDRVAQAAAQAVHAMRPASLYAAQVPLPGTILQRYSTQFPTFDTKLHVPTAIDTKIGVLQARDGAGAPIFTVMSYAAHNQEMGRVGPQLSGDWPLAFAHAYERDHGGLAMFLVGDNGSQEDPSTDPPVIPGGSENHGPNQYEQAQATGEEFARIVAGAAATARPLRVGSVGLRREAFCVPLENLGFAGLAALGDFGQRQAWTCTPDGAPIAPNGPVGADFRTYVAVGHVGPDLQLIDNPGEAFPALMVGSPYTSAEESCSAPNPAVPTWHARATFRFQVGLADDMIGYMEPAWAWVSSPPQLFPTACQSDADGWGHRLEDEGVGPKAANAVADRLAALLDAHPDPTAHVGDGRYVQPDGSLTARPAGAVGIVLAGGRTVALPGVESIGGRPVDAHGEFMDYDGQPQDAGADVLTRGMIVFDATGCAVERDYVSVFDAFAGMGGAVGGAPDGTLPARGCPRPDGTQ